MYKFAFISLLLAFVIQGCSQKKPDTVDHKIQQQNSKEVLKSL